MKIFIKTTFAILFFWTSHVQSQVQNSNTNLHLAVLQGNLEQVSEILKSGSNINEKDQYGSTPLIIATTFGKSEIAKILIEKGADLSLANNQGSTPLHIAAFFCHEDIVRMLLLNGADKYTRNNDGVTAYDIVTAPYEMDQETYNQLESALGPMGLKVDSNYIKTTRPRIAELLMGKASDYKLVNYKPLNREDWNVSNPSEQGLNNNLVDEFFYEASHLKTLYGLLIVKNGSLIAEGYFNKGSVDQLSQRASVTKSYVSALLGIAIEKGCLSGVDQKMVEFFTEIESKIADPRKKTITIKQMLQMRAGYPWEETEDEYWNTIWSGKYIDAVEDIPLTHDPGSTFQYSNLTSNWLAIIISRACKTDLKSFGEKYLFSPLRVKIGDWPKDLDGYRIGSGDIQFTARDMAKFGMLYLNEGQIDGRQIIPAEWVKESTQKYSTDINSTGVKSGRLGRYFKDVGYGYQWWSASVGEHQFNYAWGHGGQLIVILRDLDIVIVTTADPFYGKEAHFNAWKHEQSIINLVGKFIKSLP
ncbi:MAG: ankyrin repeat domain-containing protein [Algoriphagus sp.]|uniref:serine hydrolase n=1 Tax=Algoriphagus sp. TaxID=1872435 RepID=UPI0017D37739|nr:serine hydrolase [Algoriphagus sp.]NVJ87254.1 ankyrin repeat domain-containing protein [Algoriphagus sp.]